MHHVDVRDGLPEAEADGIERVMGISMTYDGHLAAAATGALFVFDRDLERKDYVLFPGEHVENSIAVDENAIYVVTSKHMHRIVWTGERLSTDEADGAWKSPYNVMPEGEAISLGAASHGSGTTPSLMGFGADEDKLVIISDGDPEGANLVAFWREEIPEGFEQKPGTKSRRNRGPDPHAGQPDHGGGFTGDLRQRRGGPQTRPIRTRRPPRSASSATPSCQGPPERRPSACRSSSGIPPKTASSKAGSCPRSTTPIGCHRRSRPRPGSPTSPPRSTAPTNTRAVDWETGEEVARWQFPDDGVIWNNWGGITTLLDDGDLLLGGFFAVKRYDVGHLR